MHFYLGLHPQIHVSREKELHFFTVNYSKGEDWYRSWFPRADLVQGEASPSYAANPRFLDVPERMHSLVPDAKLIYIVRDPIDRAVSDYWHERLQGNETRDISVLRNTEGLYFKRGLYHFQIMQYLSFFDIKQLLVIDQSELRQHRNATLRTVHSFLGVDPGFESPLSNWERHRSIRKRTVTPTVAKLRASFVGRAINKLPSHRRWIFEELIYRPFSRRTRRPSLDTETRAFLHDSYKPETDKLRTLLDRPFASWTV